MNKPKVIAYQELPDVAVNQLKEHVNLIHIKNLEQDYKTFLNELKDSQGLIGMGLPVSADLLEQAPELKIVSNISVGYDNFDLEEMNKHSVMGTNTPDVLTDTTADAMMALVLAAARRVPELDRFVKDKKWTEMVGMEEYGIDVHHKKLGIIGMGRIGAAVAKRAHFGFDMEILYHNRSKKENEFGAQYCSLDDLLAESDYVLLMAPANKNTPPIMGEKQFSQMKESAIFINGSRGENVDEKALIKSLKADQIYAAALDVFEKEPIQTDNELLQLKNVVTVPHIGSATFETRMKMFDLAMKNLLQGLNHQEPVNLVNKEAIM
ncbi:bifunctional glyoxylate/hydroxypyruvate reductase B [Virgibacillus phasianinus]|uniref:Glyoxylate/hydroxypyruvate reductase B n=1 Tax=Virgibacillus phasianinus TaxID=2017483 RepID=A0A220U1E9_9BACI|nr:D-glycerate dehydrogenase [Virgibacillus phasianinus]ASK61910.1 bifunctional glyoxylate/hydroxypyruvate reductase B [Virgibacillus phasianinus]